MTESVQITIVIDEIRYEVRMTRLDSVDKQIISILQRDGRTPNAEIARRLDISEGTVRRRVEALITDGVIQATVITNPYKVGLNTLVFFHLNVEPKKTKSVCDRLMEMPEARYVSFTTGEHDIMVEALFPSNADLVTFIRDRLALIPGVTKIETNLQLQILKRSYEWQMPDGDISDEESASPLRKKGGENRAKVWRSEA